jgi:Cu2+-exporting ATPase
VSAVGRSDRRTSGHGRETREAGATLIAHETATRLRLRLPADADLDALHDALLALPGVTSLRRAGAARSLVIVYDGRAGTRREVLAHAERMASAPAQPRRPQPSSAGLPLGAALAAGALVPLLPPQLRPAAAALLVGAKTVGALRSGAEPGGAVLDAIALATTALTGHPLTATTSVLVGAAAERWRDALVDDTDRLLAQLTPPEAPTYRVRRGMPPAARTMALDPAQMQAGDCLRLAAGDVVPADGIVTEGAGALADWLGTGTGIAVRAGERIGSGERIARGALTLRVERPAAASRAARLRAHVRHALRSSETAGPLTPDLQRLVALPVSAAGLVLALTGDTARTASMLQADPQYGLQLAHPVARAAALYASARHGALMSGLDAIERLAAASTFAFEDVGVLAESTWHLDRVIAQDAYIDATVAERWLLRLMGASGIEAANGFPDERVAAWREHGAVLPLADEGGARRVLHIGGAHLLARTWGIELTEPDRRSLVRRLGIVQDGRLLATVHLGCRLRERVGERIAALRALGVQRIAVFTEDPAAMPAAALTTLGADAVVSSDRAAQERWLDEAVARGERVALVHTGLRDLLPPGGLSLCPVDAEAGAHGVLLGDPLAALLSARAEAQRLRRALRWQFGGSVTANSVLMVLAAMQAASPLAISALRHGFALLLLGSSARLARVARSPAPLRAARARRGTVQRRTERSHP